MIFTSDLATLHVQGGATLTDSCPDRLTSPLDLLALLLVSVRTWSGLPASGSSSINAFFLFSADALEALAAVDVGMRTTRGLRGPLLASFGVAISLERTSVD